MIRTFRCVWMRRFPNETAAAVVDAAVVGVQIYRAFQVEYLAMEQDILPVIGAVLKCLPADS